MSTRTTTHLPRRPLAALFAAAAAFGGITFVAPQIASAEPPEWDIGSYDACTDYAGSQFVNGQITQQELQQQIRNCCDYSGGIVSESQECVAPVAEQAQEAERTPVEPPGVRSESEATLWMPPPPPIPGAIPPGPASRN